MTRVLAQYLSLETAALGLVEFVLSCVFILATLTFAGEFGALLGSTAALTQTTDLAFALTLPIVASAAAMGLYRPDICLKRHGLVVNVAVAGLAALPVMLLVAGAFHVQLTGVTVLWLTMVLLAGLACILITRLSVAGVLQHRPLARRVLVIGSDRRAARMSEMLRTRFSGRFEPVAISNTGGTALLAALQEQRIWGVVFAADDLHGPLAETLLDSKLRGLRVFRDTGFSEQHLGRIDLETIDAAWMLSADGFANSPLGSAAKRAADIVVSLLLLMMTLPLMLLTMLLIRLDSPGPVLYRQQRIGLHGKPFTLLKFRSMTVDAEVAGSPRWAELQDPRVTRVGSFIRPMRIDELPQLFNVLRGEMSMTGPRPERTHFVEQLTRIIPFYRERTYVKPGLTGWAQVNYPYGASVEDAREKLAYDLYYVKNRNLLLDLLILLSTVRVILFREGAR